MRGLLDGGSQTVCQRCCSNDACNAQICHSNNRDMHETMISTSTYITTTAPTYTDCWDLQNRGGFKENGIYDIYPTSSHAHLRIRCDMITDGGGWTILQRRYDGSLKFNRTFQQYEEGFGDATGEYWVGLEWIHVLTSQGVAQMRVDLCAFNNSQPGYAEYSDFNVANRSDTYMLNLGTFRNGSTSDAMSHHDGRVFQATGSCANQFRGGWWYVACYTANLNGGRYNGGVHQGITWGSFGGSDHLSLRSSEMKIRPLHVPADPAHPYNCPP